MLKIKSLLWVELNVHGLYKQKLLIIQKCFFCNFKIDTQRLYYYLGDC